MRWTAIVIALPLLLACEPRDVDVFTFVPLPFDASVPDVSGFTATEFELGRSLFFDPVLSGNQNVSCATCHIPFLQTAEHLPLSIGEGGEGLGPERTRADGAILPRNSLSVLNRAGHEVPSLLWDGRVERLEDGSIRSPVALPEGVETLLAAQALLPLLDRDEMRGHAGENELADIEDDDSEVVWAAIMVRLMTIPSYMDAFGSAFPDTRFGEHTIVHLAQALATFQEQQWSRRDSRFDSFREGLVELSEEEQRGHDLFFGSAGCGRCHNGAHLSDGGFYNIGVPQLGPGKDSETSLDVGRALVTGELADQFRFRTPSLRNVRMTAPYMHNGAYSSLESAVRHHLDAAGSLESYDGRELPETLRAQIHDDPETHRSILGSLDDPAPLTELTDTDITDLLSFLATLDSAVELGRSASTEVPTGVLSGALVETCCASGHPSR